MTSGYFCQSSDILPDIFDRHAHEYDEILHYDAMGNIKSLKRTFHNDLSMI
jgi:hypothetical protein